MTSESSNHWIIDSSEDSNSNFYSNQNDCLNIEIYQSDIQFMVSVHNDNFYEGKDIILYLDNARIH